MASASLWGVGGWGRLEGLKGGSLSRVGKVVDGVLPAKVRKAGLLGGR